jgi:hypothetical protein
MISDGGAIGDGAFHTWADEQGIPPAKQDNAIAKLSLVDAQCDISLGQHYFSHLLPTIAAGLVRQEVSEFLR